VGEFDDEERGPAIRLFSGWYLPNDGDLRRRLTACPGGQSSAFEGGPAPHRRLPPDRVNSLWSGNSFYHFENKPITIHIHKIHN